MKRLLGVDYGTKRIGVAVSDPLGIMAHPVAVIDRRVIEEDIARIRAIIAEYPVEKIVLGLPLNMDGTPGRLVDEVRGFGRRLERDLGVPVELIDERLTSYQADQMLIEDADLSREKRRKVKDKIAASLILQAYLDRG